MYVCMYVCMCGCVCKIAIYLKNKKSIARYKDEMAV